MNESWKRGTLAGPASVTRQEAQDIGPGDDADRVTAVEHEQGAVLFERGHGCLQGLTRADRRRCASADAA